MGLSLAGLLVYISFTKTELICRISIEISQSIYFVEQFLLAASEKREFKQMCQIRKLNRVSLVFERLLT